MHKISRRIHHLECRIGSTPVIALGSVRYHVKHLQRIKHTNAKVVRTSNLLAITREGLDRLLTLFSLKLLQQINTPVSSEKEAYRGNSRTDNQNSISQTILIWGVVQIRHLAFWRREGRSVQINGSHDENNKVS